MRRWVLSKSHQTMEDGLYSDFLEKVAFGMGRTGGILVVLLGIVWMACLPSEQSWFLLSAWPYVGLIGALFFVAMPFIQKRRRLCTTCNYMAFVMTIVMTVLLAAVREPLRVGTLLESAGFNPMNLAVHWDVPSLAIFFVTFLLVGGTALAYIFISAWKAGLATGRATRRRLDPVSRSGTSGLLGQHTAGPLDRRLLRGRLRGCFATRETTRCKPNS